MLSGLALPIDDPAFGSWHLDLVLLQRSFAYSIRCIAFIQREYDGDPII